MGAYDFSVFQTGRTASEAFATAREQAGYEHGHGGYSGTIYEKQDFVVVSDRTLDLASADKLAQKLMDEYDSRINDKWGPAGAIPVALDYREVRVEGLAGNDRYDAEAVRAAAEAKLREAKQLRRGESVLEANIYSCSTETARSYGGYAYGSTATRATAKFTNGVATVKVKKAGGPVDRTVTATLTFDHEPTQGELKAAVVQAAKLKPNETLLDFTTRTDPKDYSTDGIQRITKAVAKATEGKPVTKYLIRCGHEVTPWERGFPSQAAARARAVEIAEQPRTRSLGQTEAVWEVTSETRRENGDPLVRVQRVVTRAVATVTMTVRFTPPDLALREPDGWLFFGWASS